VLTVILGHEVAFRVQARLWSQERFLICFEECHVGCFHLVVECGGGWWKIGFFGVVEDDVVVSGLVNWFLMGVSMMGLNIGSA
jgi:hypothetical protein